MSDTSRLGFASVGPSTNAILIGTQQYILGSAVGFIIDSTFRWASDWLEHKHKVHRDLIERIGLNLGQATVNSFFIYQSIQFMYGKAVARDPVLGVPFVLGLISHQPFFFKNAAHCCNFTRKLIQDQVNGVPEILQDEGGEPVTKFKKPACSCSDDA